MNLRRLPLLGLLLVTAQAFAETTPLASHSASRLAADKITSTTIASSLNPSTVGASVTFTVTVLDRDSFFPQIVNEGTVTFSEGATVLAADVPVAAGAASFSTTALTAGTHVITAVYNGTATFGTSMGMIAQTVDGPGPCPTYSGNIAYVNASATPGTNDGTTWATAFLTLQAAFDAARTCGVTQIWVAQGTYVPTTYPIGAATNGYGGVLLSSADFSFHLVNGVAVYGGFSGSGTETHLSQRNWRQNPTILSGNNALNHVVTSANDGLATRLDGFTITGGNANGSGGNNVSSRVSGGGMSLTASSITLSNLIISGNSATVQGGGMEMQGGASVLTNVAFVGNTAGSSGGGMNAKSTFTMTNCVFSGNTAVGVGGGMVTGGAQNTSATLTNVVFANNTATRTDNIPTFGGAMVNNGGVTTLVNCTFFGNSATGGGGAMYNSNDTAVTDKNGIYYGNSAPTSPDVYKNPNPSDNSSFTPTTTLMGTDPKFVNSADPDGPDNVWMTADDGLALQSTSPAINAGTAAGAPSTDILGAARVGNPDQGAYEYNPCVIPTAFAVAGGGGYCAGGSGVAIGLSGSESGVSYQLKDANGNVGDAVPGTGNTLSFGNQTTAGNYTVTATNATTNCTADMTGSATVTVDPLPTTFAVSGGGSYCAGSTGVAVRLSNSQSGVNYQLKRDNGNMGSPLAGTDGPISFGNQTSAGNYTVTATNATTNCTADMSGTATVTVNPLPTATVSGGGTVCAGQPLPNVSIALTGTAPFTFTYTNGTTPTTVTGTSTNPYVIANAPAGTYTVTALSDAHCTGTSFSGSATVIVRLAINLTTSGNTTVIYGYASNCTTLSASASGGTGAISLSWSTGATSNSIQVCPTTTTTYTVTATDAAGCTVSKDILVTVNDVRCGYGGVKVCLGGREQCIAQYLVPTYLRLGATLGGCNAHVPARLSYEQTQEVPFSLSLKAYPNPVHDAVSVEVLSPSAGAATFEVLDMTGRVRQARQQNMQPGLNEVELRLGTLPTGIYLIRAVDALGRQATVRVSKE